MTSVERSPLEELRLLEEEIRDLARVADMLEANGYRPWKLGEWAARLSRAREALMRESGSRDQLLTDSRPGPSKLT